MESLKQKIFNITLSWIFAEHGLKAKVDSSVV